MPTMMRDRWHDRAEPGVGFGTVYWHVLMRDHPEVVAAVEEIQVKLTSFHGLHMPPSQWLHMTTCVAGPTAEIDRSQMLTMIEHARKSLRGVVPAEVSVGRILYHPEAIMVAVEPRKPLIPLLAAAANATSEITDLKVSPARREAWTPHVTIAYSIAEQEAAPIAKALTRSIRLRKTIIEKMSLVIQWGPERAWDWEIVGEVHIST